MTLPGLALFYGGLVRARNLLSVLMHCFSICCLVSVLWLVGRLQPGVRRGQRGRSAASGGRSWQAPAPKRLAGTMPEVVFFMFQMTFAIITPALIVGAYPERITFPAVLLFSAIWLLLVYAPVAHWIWGGGWLAALGVMDFAGGLVVHLTAGASALVLALVIGRRRGFPHEPITPHSPGMTMAGAAMLWVGWFGFNGGSALAANGNAGHGDRGHPRLGGGRRAHLGRRSNGSSTASRAWSARSPAWSRASPRSRPPRASSARSAPLIIGLARRLRLPVGDRAT